MIPGLGRTPGGGHGNPLQYPCLENPGQRRLVGYHGVAKSNMTEQLCTHNMQSTKDLIFQFNAFALLHLLRKYNFKLYYIFILMYLDLSEVLSYFIKLP